MKDYPLLKRGSTHTYETKALQGLLFFYGHLNGNGIDGFFGQGTESAVKAFQKRFDLDIDGIVGRKTWNCLLSGPVIADETAIDQETTAPTTPIKTVRYSPEVEAETMRLWMTLDVTAPDRTEWYVNKSLENKARYEAIAMKVNPAMPWWFVAVVHGLEASFRFSRHLHNGDPLEARTINIPKDRPIRGNPPFTWEESAYDALTMTGKEYDKVTDWTISHILWMLEGYNGYGYRIYRGIFSPYLWAGTNHYSKGKYVSDGVWDPDAISKQAGAAGVIHILNA